MPTAIRKNLSIVDAHDFGAMGVMRYLLPPAGPGPATWI